VSRAKGIVCVIAVVSVWALLSAGSASASGCPDTDTQVSGVSQSRMESSILCLINEDRTSRGLGAVQPSNALRQAALGHSNEMVDEGYFDHTSPAGLTFIDRILATGYARGARSWIAGENLVWGSGALGTPQALVTAWMNSAPHRENLLRGRFREIGIAAVVGTPESRNDSDGVTVSSEYGFRATKKRHAKDRKARKATRQHAKTR
jgi:uncharacterized protein YkwD